MADTSLIVELVTPEALLISQEAEMVVVPGSEGDFGVLIDHAPLIAGVRLGVMRIHEAGGAIKQVFVAGGFAEVTGERCVVLAEEAVPVEAIESDKVLARLEKAKTALARAKDDKAKLDAEKEIAIAEAMLAAVA